MADSTCFRAFEYFNELVVEACGHSIPVFTTEGGYNVGQRAGTTAGDDPRWPKPSPQRTAELTLAMFRAVEEGPDYYFACMPWLLACKEMGYWQNYFEQQGPWFSWDFQFDWRNCAGGQLPVVRLLKDNPGRIKGEDEMTNTRRMGIWGVNYWQESQTNLMLSWSPGALTCFFDYMQANHVRAYKDKNPGADIIIRFMHPQNWQDEPEVSARNYGREIGGKWPELKSLEPYVYFANEMNLHYENGDPNVGNQWRYERPEFYEKYARWVRWTAETVIDIAPDMRLVCPPFAFGHHEDDAPIDGVQPDWAGYDWLAETIKDYFDNIITFHAYWLGRDHAPDTKRLYDQDAPWYAFRWRYLADMFHRRYDMAVKIIIDECGNFSVRDGDLYDQLFYFAQQSLSDPRVLAVTPFLWSDPTYSAGNLPNAWAQGVPDLPGLVNKLKAMPNIKVGEAIPLPPPEPEPPPAPEPEPEPPPPAPQIEMTVEDGPPNALPLIVGNWLEPNKIVRLYSPYDTPVGQTRTGNKQEYGPNGFEAGYAHNPGSYTLEIDGNEFQVEGGGFRHLSFQKTGADNILVRIVSDELKKSRADKILQLLNENQMTKGVFNIEQ